MPAKHEILKDLKTERLILKPISQEYIKEIYIHFSDPDVTKYMDIDVLESIEKVEEIIRYYTEREDKKECNRWVVLEKDDNTFLGTCGFNSWERKRANRAEIGYDLSKKYWKKGFMSEAVTRLIKHGFEV